MCSRLGEIVTFGLVVGALDAASSELRSASKSWDLRHFQERIQQIVDWMGNWH